MSGRDLNITEPDGVDPAQVNSGDGSIFRHEQRVTAETGGFYRVNPDTGEIPADNIAPRSFSNRLKYNRQPTYSITNGDGITTPLDDTSALPTNISGGKFGKEIQDASTAPDTKNRYPEMDEELEALDREKAALDEENQKLALALVYSKKLGGLREKFARQDVIITLQLAKLASYHIDSDTQKDTDEIQKLKQEIQTLLSTDDISLTQEVIDQLDSLVVSFETKTTELSEIIDASLEKPQLDTPSDYPQDFLQPKDVSLTTPEVLNAVDVLKTPREREIKDIEILNIFPDGRVKGKYKIKTQKGVRVLSTKEAHDFHMIKATLENYVDFILSLDDQNNAPELTTLKDAVIDLLQTGNVNEADNLARELGKVLDQAIASRENLLRAERGSKKGIMGVLRPKKGRTIPLDEDDAARGWDDYQASLRNEDAEDDSRKQFVRRQALVNNPVLSSPVPTVATSAVTPPTIPDPAIASDPSATSPSPSGGGTTPPPPSGPPSPPPPPSDPPSDPPEPPTPDKAPIPLVIRMSLEGIIRVVTTTSNKNSKDEALLNGVYLIRDGKPVRIKENEVSWRGLIDIFNGDANRKGLYNRYLAFFESGSYKERSAKKEKYKYVIERENDFINQVQDGNLQEALVVCDNLDRGLEEAEEDWKLARLDIVESEEVKRKKAEEQLKIEKLWDTKEKEFNSLEAQATRLMGEVSPDSAKHIEKELGKLKQYKALVKKDSGVFDGTKFTAYEEALNLFKQTVDRYENTRNAISRFTVEDRVRGGTRTINGSVLRPNRVAANDARVHLRDGTSVSVAEYEALQAKNKVAQAIKVKGVETSRLEFLEKRYRQEADNNPVEFIRKYLYRLDLRFPSGYSEEKKIVQKILNEKIASGVITEEDLTALAQAAKQSVIDPRAAHKRATLVYSPAAEAKEMATKEGKNLAAARVAAREIASKQTPEEINTRLEKDRVETVAITGKDPEGVLSKGGLDDPLATGLTSVRPQQSGATPNPVKKPDAPLGTLKGSAVTAGGPTSPYSLGGASNAPDKTPPGAENSTETRQDMRNFGAPSAPPVPPKSPEELKKTEERKSLVAHLHEALVAQSKKFSRPWLWPFMFSGAILLGAGGAYVTRKQDNVESGKAAVTAVASSSANNKMITETSEEAGLVEKRNYKKDVLILPDQIAFFETLENLTSEQIIKSTITEFKTSDNPSSFNEFMKMSAYDLYHVTTDLPGVTNGTRGEFSRLIKKFVGVFVAEKNPIGMLPTSTAYPGKGESVLQFVDRIKRNVQHANKGEPLEKATGSVV